MTAIKPDLTDAIDTDEIYTLAFKLAAWGLRNGECDEFDVVEWVLDHPHDEKLERGTHGPNPTRHHIVSGATAAAETYDPDIRSFTFDPEPVQELAARISGSKVTHEKYLLGVMALCFKYQTVTPVITGRLLGEVVGVSEQAACDVLRQWSKTRVYGLFTKVTYDGERGHGRIWTVNVDWIPTSKPKHLPGCNRSAARCRCPGLSQNPLTIFTAEKIAKVKCDSTRFSEWVSGLKPGSPVTVTDACKALGVTRHKATQLMRSSEGGVLKQGTYSGGRVRRRQSGGSFKFVTVGETWFVA